MNINIFKIAGFVVGLILSLVIFKLANTNHKVNTQYDERQMKIRGKGYMYGFYAMMICEAVMSLLDISEFTVPVSSSVLHFGVILVGILVLTGYTIWNGAYWGLNNNRRTYGIVLILIGLLNAVPVIRSIREGTFLKAGESSLPVINLLLLIMLVFIGAAALIRHILDAGADEDK